MITIPEIRTGPLVKHYTNDEVHIVGKAHKSPSAVLSFVAVDDEGERIDEAPVVTISLSAEAYNEWYSGWDGEKSLYSQIIAVMKSGKSGFSISGADMSRIGGIDNISIPASVDEVIN